MSEVLKQSSIAIAHIEQSIINIVHFIIGLFSAIGDLFLIVAIFVVGVLFFRLFFHFIGAIFIITFFMMFIGIALAIIGH